MRDDRRYFKVGDRDVDLATPRDVLEWCSRGPHDEAAEYIAECVRQRIAADRAGRPKFDPVQSFGSWQPGPGGDAARKLERDNWSRPPRTKRDEENERLREAFENDKLHNEAADEAVDEWDADGASAGLGIQCYRDMLREAIKGENK